VSSLGKELTMISLKV